MAVQRRKPAAEAASRRVPADEKIARLLGMLLVKDIKKKTDQVPTLRSVGFTVGEVAEMLGMTENHVKVADHLGRKKRKAS
jgi:DNA-directed RNA polymerase specialized sigma24 family protein